MATYATLTVNAEDIIGADFDRSRASVWVEANTEHGLIVVDGTSVRVGGRRENLVDGVATFQLVTTNSADNPTSFGYRVTIVYVPKGSRRQGHDTVTTADFPLTASANLAAIPEAWDNVTTPVSWRSEFRDEMEAIRDETAAIADLDTVEEAIILVGDARYPLLVNIPTAKTLDDWAAGSATGHYLHGVSSTNGLNLDPAGTMAGVENAILAHPSDVVMIDLDYRKTIDGALASLHDATTVNVSDITVTVADTAYRDLPEIYKPILYGTGHARTPVAAIESILAQARGRCVFSIEIKDGLPAVAEAVGLGARLGMLDKIVWNTGDPTVVAAIVAAGGRAFMFNCNTTTKLDQAAAAGAWMVDVPTDANTAFVDYAVSKGFARIIRGFINTAGTPVVTDAFAQVASIDPRLDGYSSDATGYLDRPGGINGRSAKNIAGMVRTGKRAPGLRVINSSNITDWLAPARLYTYKAGAMVYTFGSLAGTVATTGTLTMKPVFDTLPSTLTQSTRFKLFSPTENPANASANTVEGYVEGAQADGLRFLNSTPVGGGSPTSVFSNLQGLPFVAGTEETDTLDWDDTGGTNKIRLTIQRPVATLSGAVSAGTITSLPVNALAVAIPTGSKLLLPDGTVVTTTALASAAATSISITSIAVAAMASGAGLRLSSGWVTEGAKPIWRGKYHSVYTTQTNGVGGITDFATT